MACTRGARGRLHGPATPDRNQARGYTRYKQSQDQGHVRGEAEPRRRPPCVATSEPAHHGAGQSPCQVRRVPTPRCEHALPAPSLDDPASNTRSCEFSPPLTSPNFDVRTFDVSILCLLFRNLLGIMELEREQPPAGCAQCAGCWVRRFASPKAGRCSLSV
jgi:hypothetical protein